MAQDWSAFGGGSRTGAPAQVTPGGQDWTGFTSSRPPTEQQGVKWLTGGQKGATNNAFDNDFYDTWNKQIDEQQKKGDLLGLYGRDDFTGIVTRDDEKYGKKFGEVYIGGKRQYDILNEAESGIDNASAYQMLGRVTLSDDELAHAVHEGDLEKFVQAKRGTSEKEAKMGQTRQDFDEKVDKRQEEFNAGSGDEWIAAGGTIGGIAAGLGAAAVVASSTGVGAVAGIPMGVIAAILGVGGAAAGFAGAMMNRDLLSEQAARAQIMTEQANLRSPGAGTWTGIEQAGAFGVQLMSPLTNIVMGAQDLSAGGGEWNNESEWYAVDPETGRSLRNGLWDVARFGAGAVDAFGTGAGVGKIAYFGSIGTSMLGQGGRLAATGEVFNERSGDFQSIYLDEEGDFAAGRAASAWGAFGIDAVQSLGMFSMLTRSQQRGANTRAGGAVDKEATGGFRFELDENGRAIGKAKLDVSFFAPSEAFRGISAASLLRLQNKGATVSADDLYRSIKNLENKAGAGWGATLTTAMGEGYEEGVQAVLEQWSTGSAFDLDSILQAAAQGSAAGLGMGAAGARMAYTGDRALRAQADAAMVVSARPGQDRDSLKPYTDPTTGKATEQWNKMSDVEKRAAANLNIVDKAAIQTALGNVSMKQARTILLTDSAAAERFDVARLAISEKVMANAAPNTKAYMRITAFEDPGIAGDRVQASISRTMDLFTDQMKALELLANGGAPDQEIGVDAQAMAQNAFAEMQTFLPWFNAMYKQYRNAKNGNERNRIVAEINNVLTYWGTSSPLDSKVKVRKFKGLPDPTSIPATEEQRLARAYAMSLNFARDPIDQAPSFQLLVPLISKDLSRLNSNQHIQVSYSLLESIGGDFDGDRIRSILRLAQTEEQFRRGRAGYNNVMFDRTSLVAERKFEAAWIDNYRRAAQSQQLNGKTLDMRTRVLDNLTQFTAMSPSLQKHVKKMFRAMEAGKETAVRDFVTDVLKDPKIAPDLFKDAEQRFYSLPERLNRLVTDELKEFSVDLSIVEAPDMVNTEADNPLPMKKGGAKINTVRALTPGRTGFMESPSANLFRFFQQIRYSPLRSPVEARHFWEREEAPLAALHEAYLLIGQGEVESAVDKSQADPEVGARVLSWLDRMSAESAIATEQNPDPTRIPVAVLAAMPVPHFDKNGNFDGMVTLNQSLLERSIAIDLAKYGPLINEDPNVKAKYARLDGLTKPTKQDQKTGYSKKRAGAAFVYVFGQQSIRETSEVRSTLINDNSTVDQLYRSYVDKNSKGRKAWIAAAENSAEYPRNQKNVDLPYYTDDAAAVSGITSYRVMIDAIREAGNYEISTDDAGNPTGTKARQSEKVSKEIQQIVDDIQQGMSMAPLAENREMTLENLQLFLRQNPKVSEAVMGLALYDPKMLAVFTKTTVTKKGAVEVLFQPWLYEALLLPPKSAELSILLHSSLLSYQAQDIKTSGVTDIDDDDTGGLRDFERLDDRLHQLFYILAQQDPTGWSTGQLFRDVNEIIKRGGGVDEFIRIINTTYAKNQAPFVAWYRDVASFDSSSMLRFGAAVSGTEQRKAITELRNATNGIQRTMQKEREAAAAIGVKFAEAADDKRKDPNNIQPNSARMGVRQLINFMMEFEATIGPNEMLMGAEAALETFYARAADKGMGPLEFAPAAALEVMFHQFAINYVRVDTSSGTIDLDTIITNPQILMRGPIDIMGRDGKIYHWLPEDKKIKDDAKRREYMISQIEDFLYDNWQGASRSDNLPELSQGVAQSMIRRMLEPSVWQMSINGNGFHQRSLVDDSLDGLIEGNAFDRLYGDNNAPIGKHDQGSAMEWLSLWNSSSLPFGSDVDGTMNVQVWVSNYLSHRASSMENSSVSERQQEVARVHHELAQLGMKIGDLVNDNYDYQWNPTKKVPNPPKKWVPKKFVENNQQGGRKTDVLTKLRDDTRADRADRWLQKKFGGRGIPAGATRAMLDAWFNREIQARVKGKVKKSLLEEWTTAFKNGEPDHVIDAIQARLVANIKDAETHADVLELQTIKQFMLSKEPVKAYIEVYGYPADNNVVPAADRRKTIAREIIAIGMDVGNRNRWALESINAVTEAINRDGLDAGTSSASEADWNAVSRALIAYKLVNLEGGQGASEVTLPEFPKWGDAMKPGGELSTELKNWCPTQQYIFDDLLDIDKPLAKAAGNLSRLARRGNKVSIAEVARTIDGSWKNEETNARGLGAPDRVSQWTLFVPASAKEASDRYANNTAQYLVGMAGQPQDTVGLAAATRPDMDFSHVEKYGPLDGFLSTVMMNAAGNNPNEAFKVTHLLNGDPFKMQLRTFRNGQPDVMIPLANLHGRVVKSFKINGVDFDMTKIAWPHESGYWLLDLEAAKRALDISIIDPNAQLDIEFINQSSKPVYEVTPKGKIRPTNLAHHAAFDGTIDPGSDFKSPRSLIGSWLSAAGGAGRVEQQNALQAAKKGLAALKRARLFSLNQRSRMEQQWEDNLSQVLHLKAMGVADQGYNLVPNDYRFYNSYYKMQEAKHFIAGVEDGKPALWGAARIIQWQQANPGKSIKEVLGPDAKLIVPSPAKLRAMYGDLGPSAKNMPNGKWWTGDPQDILTFDGLNTTNHRMEIPGVFDTKDKRNLLGSEFGARRPFEKYTGTRTMDYDTLMKRAHRLVIRSERAERINKDRVEMGNKLDWAKVSKIPLKYLNLHIQNAPAFDWRRYGIPIDAKTSLGSQFLQGRAAADRAASIGRDGRKTVLLYASVDTSRQPSEGVLTADNFNKGSHKGVEAGPGDLIVVDVDAFREDDYNSGKAMRELDNLMETGADIIFVGQTNRTRIGVLSRYMAQSNNYEQIPGSPGHYRERDYIQPKPQDMRALESTHTSTNPVSPENKSFLLHVVGNAMEENVATVKDEKAFRKREVALTQNIIPTRVYSDFGLPKTDTAQTQVMNIVRELVSNPRPEYKSIQKALIRLDDKYRNSKADKQFPTGFLREGDLIPLVKIAPNGKAEIYFQRYKYEDEAYSKVEAQLDESRGSSDPANAIAFSKGKLNTKFTGFEGTVTNVLNDSKYGISVKMRVPLQIFGDKQQVALSGTKFVIGYQNRDTTRVPLTSLTKTRDADFIAGMADVNSKNGWHGTVYNHKSAMLAWGWDMEDKLLEAFQVGMQDPDLDWPKLRVLLEQFAKDKGASIPASQLREMMTDRAQIAALLKDNTVAGYTPGPNEELNGYVEATLLYLMGAELERPDQNPLDHILGPFGGLMQSDKNLQGQTGQELPSLFTEYFDNLPPVHKTRVAIREKMQKQLGSDANGYYVLQDDFSIIGVSTNPKTGKVTNSVRMRLQIAEMNSTGDNPAFDRPAERSAGPYEDWSPHTAAMMELALGSTMARDKDINEVMRRAVTGDGLTEVTAPDKSGASILDVMLAKVTAKVDYGYRWRTDNPAEEKYREIIGDVMGSYRVQIDVTKWKPDDDRPDLQKTRTDEFDEAVNQVLTTLNLTDNHIDLVHYWIRQTYGTFADRDPSSPNGHVSHEQAMRALIDIQTNLNNGFLPVMDAEVPMIHRDDLATIFERNRFAAKPWKLREGIDLDIDIDHAETVEPTDWDGFVKVALGIAETGQIPFDPISLTAIDGFLQTYAIQEDALKNLPISRSALVNAELWDPELSRLVISINPRLNKLAHEPAILDPASATIANQFGVVRQGNRWAGQRNVSPERRRRDAYKKSMREAKGYSTPVETGIKNFRRRGDQWIDNATTTNGVVQVVHDLRHFTTLFNPFLWLGAGVEGGVRNVLDDLAGAITGGSTGFGSRMLPQGWSKDGQQVLTQYRDTRRALQNNKNFAAMLYADMQFKSPYIRRNFLTKATGVLARAGDYMQDPTYGMPQAVMARRYIEAVVEYVNNSNAQVSPQKIMAELERDPHWVRKNLYGAHKAATARVADMRSLKGTAIGSLVKSLYEVPGKSGNAGVRMFFDLFLKTPLMYAGYLGNVTTNILGLQGANDLLLMYLNGRKKGIFGGLSAMIQGKDWDSGTQETMDFSAMIDSIDLTRSFVKGGISHSALFLAVAFAGSTGLASGEDEEERKRRLAMQYQGGGIIYDPRQIENDFRNADAIYLDGLPPFLSWLNPALNTKPGEGGEGDSEQKTMVVPHWIIRQFTSPFLGITRAVETGNMEHIKWGFLDVIDSMPIFNETMAVDAIHTFDLMTAQAAEANAEGTDVAQLKALSFLASGVMAFESMVLENSFANQMIVMADKYDRDPFVIPDQAIDGSINRDRLDVPIPTKALEEYYDKETGELGTSYKGRDAIDAMMVGFAESHSTFAFLSSLFTGLGDSKYWRNNMVAKTRSIDKQTMEGDNAASLVMAAFGQSEYAAELMSLADGSGTDPSYVMSAYAADGSEQLTDAGSEAVIRGLWNGSVRLGDKALDGLYIPYEMRQQLVDRFLLEFTQEGVDLGMEQKDAEKRAKLIIYGPYNDSSIPGLSDIIYSEEIPYTKNSRYYQLNTTYVTGPDGKPWATALTRGNLLNAFGFPLTPYYSDATNPGLPTDDLLNSVDYGANINTGMRALEKTDESWVIPTPEEIGESIEKAIEELGKKIITPTSPYQQYYGYGRGGGYGSSGGGGYANNSLMPFINGMDAPYADNVPQMYINNVNVRRADVRRERFSSERGRLNQWQ